MKLSEFYKIENPNNLEVIQFSNYDDKIVIQVQRIKPYNGMIKCESVAEWYSNYYTKGKVYEVKNGRFYDDKNIAVPACSDHYILEFDDINVFTSGVKFSEYKENENA